MDGTGGTTHGLLKGIHQEHEADGHPSPYQSCINWIFVLRTGNNCHWRAKTLIILKISTSFT